MKWIGQHIYDLAARFRGDVTIEGDLTVNGTYTQIDTDVTTTEQWLVTNDGTGPAAIINQLGSQDIFDVQDDGTSVFYIEDGGNVGIGTTSPDDILHILKDQGGGASALKLENKAGANNTGFDIDFQLASSGLSANIGAISTNNPGAGDTDMFFSTSTNGSTATEAMRITHDGNVGIGTTSPASLLHVAGKVTISDNQYLSWSTNSRIVANSSYMQFQVAATDKMRILADGNVGIGTTSPASRLDVVGGYDATPVKFLRHATYGNVIQLGRNSVSETAHIGYPGDATLNFSTAGSERMRITSAGNVGIGTTSPAYKIDIDGEARTDGLRLNLSATTQRAITATFDLYLEQRYLLIPVLLRQLKN